MEQRKGVDKLLSVFDLNIFKALNLAESISTRVMFRYDKETNRNEFKVLNKAIGREMSHRLESWLENNIKDFSEIENLKAGRMDADNMENTLIH